MSHSLPSSFLSRLLNVSRSFFSWSFRYFVNSPKSRLPSLFLSPDDTIFCRDMSEVVITIFQMQCSKYSCWSWCCSLLWGELHDVSLNLFETPQAPCHPLRVCVFFPIITLSLQRAFHVILGYLGNYFRVCLLPTWEWVQNTDLYRSVVQSRAGLVSDTNSIRTWQQNSLCETCMPAETNLHGTTIDFYLGSPLAEYTHCFEARSQFSDIHLSIFVGVQLLKQVLVWPLTIGIPTPGIWQ